MCECMVAQFLFVLLGLFTVAVVAAFLLYVSALSLVSTLVVVLGLLGALVFGYWSGSSETRTERRL